LWWLPGENPDLPANLDRLEVCFVLPSEKELLQLADMVCSSCYVLSHGFDFVSSLN
jgi:hypothetical protein